jgi:hypothetical protein
MPHDTLPARPSTGTIARRTGARTPSVLLALSLLAACGGGADDGAATAVAADAYSVPTAKPAAGGPARDGGAAPHGFEGKVAYGVPADAPAGVGAPLSGALPFPAPDAWNLDVRQAAVDPDSAALVAAIGAEAPLRLAFGAGAGVPYAVADRSTPRVEVRVAGADAPRAWPIPAALAASTDALARLAVVDRDTGVLHELRGAVRGADGTWSALAASTWRLDVADASPTDAAGPAGDDGGMPVFPGLVRRDEAEAGAIRHALRVTVPAVRAEPRWPARTAPAAGMPGAGTLPPIGLRLRLRADLVIPADASPQARAILRALQTYGAIVAGVGPAFALEGAPDAAGDAATLATELASVRGADFEALRP